MRKEALLLIASCGGKIKYGHSEVGNFTLGEEAFEQHEIEFLPTDPEFAADQLIIAKWVLRMLAEKRKVEISFAPKITVVKSGSYKRTGNQVHSLSVITIYSYLNTISSLSTPIITLL